MGGVRVKKVLILGISGQDGSYISELYSEMGYEVHGVVRRSSSPEYHTKRIDHLFDPESRTNIHYGDLSEGLDSVLLKVQPDIVVNLSAQSHVWVSFHQPIYTNEVNAIGVLRLLESIKRTQDVLGKQIRFYQASSSELWGITPPIQNENSIMQPQSPYGIAKLAAYWYTKMYRTSYDMFASNGILHNHSCISPRLPMIIRNKETQHISVARVSDIRKAKEKGKNKQQWEINDLEIWDGSSFVDLLCITATKRDKRDNDFKTKLINTRNGIIETTNHHNLLDHRNTKIKALDCKVGTKLLHGSYPKDNNGYCSTTCYEAEFLGMMVADGYISEGGKHGSFSKNDVTLRNRAEFLWENVALGYTTFSEYNDKDGLTRNIRLNGNSNYLKFIQQEIYTYDKYKKIPERILNANKDIQLAFLSGYNKCDGLKKGCCTYEFKNFKTNSAVLAQGLLYLLHRVTSQNFNITFEYSENHFGYYSINLLSPTNQNKKIETIRGLLASLSDRAIHRETGFSRTMIRKVRKDSTYQFVHNKDKPKDEIKKTLYHEDSPDWVYDIETTSGKFMFGVGNIVIANSPRRGVNFATRKITRTAARIALGLANKIELGNLDAVRDEGHSKDYMRAVTLIMNHHEPDDFVIAMGEGHTIREWAEKAFAYFNLDFYKYLIPNKELHRPSEVPALIGDSTKARTVLGWEPEYTYETLIKEMCDNDYKLAQQELK